MCEYVFNARRLYNKLNHFFRVVFVLSCITLNVLADERQRGGEIERDASDGDVEDGENHVSHSIHTVLGSLDSSFAFALYSRVDTCKQCSLIHTDMHAEIAGNAD